MRSKRNHKCATNKRSGFCICWYEKSDLLIVFFLQSQTELRRTQLNELGPKELCCRLGARPLNTIHVWPWSTAPQPDGLQWEFEPVTPRYRCDALNNSAMKPLNVKWYMKCFIYHFTFIPHGLIWTHKWPAPNVSGFLAELVRASHRCSEVTGSNPVEVLTFQAFIHNCLNCVHNCEDHSLLDC